MRLSFSRPASRLAIILGAIFALVAPDLAMPGLLGSARASTPFDSLPTSQRYIPKPTTLAFLSWAQAHADNRLAYSLNKTRATIYYVGQGTNTGGTNYAAATNPSTPRLCATPKDINDFIAATAGSGSVEYRLRRGDIWRASAANNTSLVLSVAGTTISSYAPAASNRGDLPPEITGFKAPYGASGWSDNVARGDANSNVWSRAETNTIYWVRGGDASNLYSFLRTPYTRVLTGANLAAQISNLNSAGERAWFWVGNVLYVNPGAGGSAELARIEASVGIGKGVDCQDVDDLLVRDINVTGFGMQSDNSQNYLLHSIATGSNQHTFYRCGAWWSAHHLVGQYSSPAATGAAPGGIVVFYGCRFGLGIHHSSGSTMGVSYNGDGGQEYVFAYNSVSHGALRTETYRTETGYGYGIFSHTSGAPYVAKLGLVLHNVYEDPPTNKLGGVSNIYNIEQPSHTSRRDWTKYRGFIIGDRTLGRVPVNAGAFDVCNYYVRVNGFYQLGAYTTNSQGAFSVISNFGAAINCVIDVDPSTISSASNFALINAPNSSPNSYDLINCHIRMGGKSGQGLMIDRDSPEGGQSLTCTAYNSIFEGVGSDIFYINLPNSDARTAAGGTAGCAFSNVKRADTGGFAAGWSNAGSPTDLSGQTITLQGGGCRVVGVSLPSAVGYLEYDRFGRQRPTKLYIGPGDAADIPAPRIMLREYRQAG